MRRDIDYLIHDLLDVVDHILPDDVPEALTQISRQNLQHHRRRLEAV